MNMEEREAELDELQRGIIQFIRICGKATEIEIGWSRRNLWIVHQHRLARNMVNLIKSSFSCGEVEDFVNPATSDVADDDILFKRMTLDRTFQSFRGLGISFSNGLPSPVDDSDGSKDGSRVPPTFPACTEPSRELGGETVWPHLDYRRDAIHSSAVRSSLSSRFAMSMAPRSSATHLPPHLSTSLNLDHGTMLPIISTTFNNKDFQ